MALRIDPATTRLGWIGTGVMGKNMCQHLMRAGYRTTVHTRTRAKADPLLLEGARWANTPREVAEGSDVVVTMVGYPSDVRQVMFGSDGIFAASARERVLVDMTTSSPALAIEIHS